MLASFFFTASYLQDFILVGPLILYGISFIYFLKKRRGAFNIVHCILKKSLQIAAEWQKIKNANWKCVSPQLPGISNTFYVFLHFCLSFPIHSDIEGILFLANYWKILELQINVKLDVEGLQICLLPMEKTIEYK